MDADGDDDAGGDDDDDVGLCISGGFLCGPKRQRERERVHVWEMTNDDDDGEEKEEGEEEEEEEEEAEEEEEERGTLTSSAIPLIPWSPPAPCAPGVANAGGDLPRPGLTSIVHVLTVLTVCNSILQS